MQVTINGQAREFPGALTVLEVVTQLELNEDHVAVEHNRTIVKRAVWGETTVEDGDQLEIVHFVGGG